MSRIPYYIYYLSHLLYQYNIPLIPTFLKYVNRIMWGAYIPASSLIGEGTKFGYGGSGVVIHARAKIGKNCVIGPGVTIGGRSKKYEVPVIGDNVHIATGAKVLGDIIIGNNVIIAPNSVLMKSVPSNCIVAGIPGKVIKEAININEY